MDDDVLTVETSWPATTIGGGPENFTYLEFPLSTDHAQALR
ncbi:hypothetical protein [Amycolatopsis sp. NPDC051903]